MKKLIRYKILLIILLIVIPTLIINLIADIYSKNKSEELLNSKKILINKIKYYKVSKIEFRDLNGEVFYVENNDDLLKQWHLKICNSKIIDANNDVRSMYFDRIAFMILESADGSVIHVELLDTRISQRKKETNPNDFQGIFVVYGETFSVFLKTELNPRANQ